MKNSKFLVLVLVASMFCLFGCNIMEIQTLLLLLKLQIGKNIIPHFMGIQKEFLGLVVQHLKEPAIRLV